jgi:RecB family exonuclease
VHRYSATSLEALLRCPYRFLLERLGLKLLELPQEKEPAHKEGSRLHAVLEAFYSGAFHKRKVLEDWPEVISRETFADLAFARLEKLTNLAFPRKRFGSLNYHLLGVSWPAFVAHLTKVYARFDLNALKGGYREFSFGKDLYKPKVEIGSEPKSLVGAIDSIDFVGDYWVVTDFKRKYLPQMKDVKSGLACQLSVYALALEQIFGKDLGHMLVGYYSILEGQWQAAAVGDEARAIFAAQGLVTKATPALRQVVAEVQDTWLARETEIEDLGQYRPDAAACGLCNHQDLCRKNDRRFAREFS